MSNRGKETVLANFRVSPKRERRRRSAALIAHAVEALENRRLLSANALFIPDFTITVTVSEAIAIEYKATAHETDANGNVVQTLLGAATSAIESVPGISGAYMQTYNDSGVIYYSKATGAHVIYGSIGAEYATLSGETDVSGNNVQLDVGLPTADETNLAGVTGARVSKFQGGNIYWSTATGAHVIYGKIFTEYLATANESGGNGQNVQKIIGLPTADETAVSGITGARVTTFQSGEIYSSTSIPKAHVLYGAINTQYQALAGETDVNGQNAQTDIGLPTADEANDSHVSGARVTQFQGGAIYYSSSTGANAVYGSIATEYAQLANEKDAYGRNVQTVVGLPTNDEGNLSGVTGGRIQDLTAGTIYYSAATGAHVLYGQIDVDYLDLASQTDVNGHNVQTDIGLPTSDEAADPLVSGGSFTSFQGGAIYYSTKTAQAHAVYGSIGAEYAALANEKDAYGRNVQSIVGLPTADETNLSGVSSGREQTFQGGAIYYSNATGAHVLYGQIAVEYAFLSNETDINHDNVKTLIGLPTSDPAATPNVTTGSVQTFQAGAIFYSTQTGQAHVLYGSVYAEYLTLAGEIGGNGQNVQTIIGMPTADETNDSAVSGARVTTFQSGSIYYSNATGAHVVYGATYTEYNDLSKETGATGENVLTIVGLPTADDTTVSGVTGGRVSTFQGGNIYYSSTTGAHVIYGSIFAKYLAVSGPTFLGLPTNDEKTTPDGVGRYVHFESPDKSFVGAIDWTPNYGAYAVHGDVAVEFEKEGWENNGEAFTDEIDISSNSYFGAYNRLVYEKKVGSTITQVKQNAVNYAIGYGGSVTPGPNITDLGQGASGTCWIDSSIVAYFEADQDPVNLITYEGNNTYQINLYNWNDPTNRPTGGTSAHTQTVTFDGTTYSSDLNFNPADPSQSWALIMQRGLIEAVGDWDSSQTIQNPHTGGAGDALAFLTGNAWDATLASDTPGSSASQSRLESDLANHDACELETQNSGTAFLIPGHDYAILSANSSGVELYNPWGTADASINPGRTDPFFVSWAVVKLDASLLWATPT